MNTTYAGTYDTPHKINWKVLLLSLLISVGSGQVSGLLTNSSMEIYINDVVKPPLSPPPGAVFPIVWSVLFVLMGISAYMVYMTISPYRRRALTLYIAQLIFNFFWMIIFFNARNYVFAFIWLAVLWLMVFFMIRSMRLVKPAAGNLQIPYLVWLTFAGYLNFAIILLN